MNRDRGARGRRPELRWLLLLGVVGGACTGEFVAPEDAETVGTGGRASATGGAADGETGGRPTRPTGGASTGGDPAPSGGQPEGGAAPSTGGSVADTGGSVADTGGSVADTGGSGGSGSGGAEPTGGAPTGGAPTGGSATGFWDAPHQPNCEGPWVPEHMIPNGHCTDCHWFRVYWGQAFTLSDAPAEHLEIGVKDGTRLHKTCTTETGYFVNDEGYDVDWPNAEVRVRSAAGEVVGVGCTPGPNCSTCHSADHTNGPDATSLRAP